jgi:hypothetical protein
MKRNFFRKYRRLRLENLEPRQMLAGDVTVAVVGGLLSINGDTDNNAIVISSTGNPGEFTVSSEDGTTTINGGTGPLTVSGAVRANIDLYNGADLVQFDTTNHAIHFSETLQIGSGLGPVAVADIVRVSGGNVLSVGGDFTILLEEESSETDLANVQVAGSLSISTGPGRHCLIRVENSTVSGDLSVETGDSCVANLNADVQGDVYLYVNDARISLGSSSQDLSIGGTVEAHLSSGGGLTVQRCQIGEDLVVSGNGELTVERTSIGRHAFATLGGDSSGIHFVGQNWTADYNHIGGHLVATLLGGQQAVSLSYLNVNNDLVVRGSHEGESVQLNNVRAGNSLLIDTGGGNDIVWVHNSSADGEAAILGGGGSDYVRVGNFLGGRSFYVDMAAGFDLVNMSYTSVVQTLSVSLGGDSDQATVYATSARNLSVDSGVGFDHVRIEASAADHLFAGLGDGSDSLAVVSSLARLSALFDGGAGFDVLHATGNLLNGFVRRNFEVQPA